MQGSDIQRLAQEGIEVRTDADPKLHMHHKFAVIDNIVLLNGSFNWTRQAVLGNQVPPETLPSSNVYICIGRSMPRHPKPK